MSKPVHFFLDCDMDGNWYIIPETKRDHWQRWLDIDWEEQEEAPDWAIRINNPSDVTFTDPHGY